MDANFMVVPFQDRVDDFHETRSAPAALSDPLRIPCQEAASWRDRDRRIGGPDVLMRITL
jgi:hypothetical protein